MKLKGNYETQDARLDRVPSDVTEHLEKYPLTADTMPSKASMVAGINWYSNFDRPVVKVIRGIKRYVIGEGELGGVRGGHAVNLPNTKTTDAFGWYLYYNQGTEGRCVEFAMLRMLSQLNRVRYDITSRWHYWEAQRTDEWVGGSYPNATPKYEGTSTRAGLEVLRVHGAIPAKPSARQVFDHEIPNRLRPEHGISAYRWATDWAQVREALNVPDYLPGVPLMNSWGRGYPRLVILLDGAGERVLREHGEFGIVTDR